MSRKRTARQRGFTFIELMTVVAITGIMFAVGIPAIKRYVDRSRRQDAAQTGASTGHAEAIRTVERARFSQVEVVDVGEENLQTSWSRICRAAGDFAYEVDATDKQERRVRLTICCHKKAGTVKCAIPLPMHPFPGDR